VHQRRGELLMRTVPSGSPLPASRGRRNERSATMAAMASIELVVKP
jgi:hypothetical protein